MALSATVTKGSVSQISPTEFNVSVHVSVVDDALPLEPIMEGDYTKRYTNGDTLASVQSILLKKVQEDWDKKQAEQTIFDAAAFATLCSNMQTTINDYLG